MTDKTRKGHNFERIVKEFTQKDIENFKPKEVFNDKWIILRNLGARGDTHCYDVCDKQAKQFGVLYLEIGQEGVSSVANQVEFSHKHYSMGNSHRFTLILDVDLINNHVFYMVVLNRPGPTLRSLLATSSEHSAITVAFIAIDLLAVAELLTSSGYVLRNFDANQWKLDVKSRMFYLADMTDVCVISDKRYRLINESHFANESVNLHWRNEDLTYAPISYCIQGKNHRMSELDMIETFVYLIYDLARKKLPWKNLPIDNAQKIIDLKTEFMNDLPDVTDSLETDEDVWFHTALRNVTEYLKLAKKTQEKLEKLPVRDGAWCPNGARAGALLSTVRYREIIDDFHKVVSSGRPVWSVHWRDVKLDWDREFHHNPKTLELLKKIEKREIAAEVAKETFRLQGSRVHYEIMKEHGEEEHRLNSESIKNYLDENQNEEEKDVKVIPAVKPVRRTRRTRKQIEEDRMEVPAEEDVKEEVKEEPEDEQEQQITSSKPLSARAARLQNRLQMKEILAYKPRPKKGGKGASKATEDDEEMIVKTEEPDDYEELPGPSQPAPTTIEFSDSDDDIKIEEPDDY